MTLKQLFETPMANDMICYVVGENVIFQGHNLSGGKFIVINRQTVMNGEDYDIIELSIKDNRLQIEICK